MKKIVLIILLLLSFVAYSQNTRSRAEMLVRMAVAENEDGISLDKINPLFEKAEEIDRYPELYYMWGYTLASHAEKQKSDSLYRAAIAKIKKVEAIDPENKATALIWGEMLYNYAQMKNEVAIFQESFDILQKAQALEPDNADVYKIWAAGLLSCAKKRKDKAIYQEAIEKFSKAISLDPKDSYIYNGLAISYMELGTLEKSLLKYREPIESTLLKQETMSVQSAAYNLACFYSLLNEKDEAMQWLEKVFTKPYTKKMDGVNRTFFDEDKDLNNIRKDKRYKELVNTYLPK